MVSASVVRRAAWVLLPALALGGCTVVTVGAAAVGVTATAVGLAADAAVGTAKLAGKGVGKAYGAMTDDPPPDASGLSIRYRQSDPNHPWQPGPGMRNDREPEPAESTSPPPVPRAATPAPTPKPAPTPAPRTETPSFTP